MFKSALTPKEEDVVTELTEFFIDGGESCLACMIENHWGISTDNKDFIAYADKQRRLVKIIGKKLKRLDPKALQATEAIRNNDILWLMAVQTCEHHPMFRKYKILQTALDHEIMSNLTAQRLEGAMINQKMRVESAVRLFPTVFRRGVLYIKGNVPYLQAALTQGIKPKNETS